MTRKPGLSAFALALFCAGSALGGAIPLTGLAPRGTPQATDLVPLLPAGGTQMLSTQAGDLQNFVLTSVKAFGALGDGVTDDTAAIQSAINSGLPIFFPPGTYVTSASLLVETYASNGQLLRGSGTWGAPGTYNSAAYGPGATVIKPTSAVTAVFVIDGAPISGGGYSLSWIQGFGMENLLIDMANMPDAATSAAIEQIQAWDAHYASVRVVNDGASKRAWLLKAGAFTTTLLNTQGNILDMEGANASFGVTTITVMNHDGGSLICNWCANIRVTGGAFQGAGTKFAIANSSMVDIATDIEGSGVAYALGTNANGLFLHSELQGFAGTYMTGAVGNGSVNLDQQTNFNTYPFNLTYGQMMLNNQGAAGFSRFLSGATGSNYYLGVGRTGLDSLWGVAAAGGDFVIGTAPGDTVLETFTSSSAIWIAPNQGGVLKVTPTGAALAGALSVSGALTATSPSYSR